MSERELLLEQIAANRQLMYLAVILCFAMFLKEVLMIGRMIRRYLGMHGNIDGDPLDNLSLGQFKKARQEIKKESDDRTAAAVKALNEINERRLTGIEKQLEISRQKDNTMLIILRDLHSFMIYGQKPQRALPTIEEG